MENRPVAAPRRAGPSTSGYVAQVGAKMAGLAGASRQTAAATPGQSDKLTPANQAAVDAMYPKTAATPAVQQPPGATGTPPFLPKTDTEGTAAAATMPAAANNVATGPAGITGPPQQPPPATAPPPAQAAQAQPVAPPQTAPAAQPTGGGALLPGDSPTALANRQKADAYMAQQANALMANPMTKTAGEGMMERAKASMAITNAMQERLTKQSPIEYAAGLQPETAGRRQIAEAKGKRVGEVIEAGGKNARDTLNDLNTIEDAVRAGGDNVQYGPGAENWNKAKQFLNNIFPEAGLAEADTIVKMNATGRRRRQVDDRAAVAIGIQDICGQQPRHHEQQSRHDRADQHSQAIDATEPRSRILGIEGQKPG